MRITQGVRSVRFSENLAYALHTWPLNVSSVNNLVGLSQYQISLISNILHFFMIDPKLVIHSHVNNYLSLSVQKKTHNQVFQYRDQISNSIPLGRRSGWRKKERCACVCVCVLLGDGYGSWGETNKILQDGGLFQGRMAILFAICHFLSFFLFQISPKDKRYSNLHFLINYRSSYPRCPLNKVFFKKFAKFPGK